MKESAKAILLLFAAALINQAIGGLLGVLAGISFFVIMASLTARPKRIEANQQPITLPGKVIFKPSKEMGFNINGQEFIIRANDEIVIDVPEKCCAVNMMFANKYDDSILDEKFINDEKVH